MSAFDRQEFKRVFDEQRDPLFRFLFRLTRNASDADDLLQETFLAVWRKRADFQGRGSEAGYLRRTAFRLYLNARERSDRRASLAPTVAASDIPHSPTGEHERNESIRFLVARVEESLEGLPDAAREAFVLFRYEGLTCAQIADLVGAPVKTIETRILRATRQLSERLAPYRHHVRSL